MKAVRVLVIAIEIPLMLGMCYAAYRAFVDESGGLLAGLAASTMTVLVIAGVTLALRSSKLGDSRAEASPTPERT